MSCKHFDPFSPGCKAFDNIPESIISGINKHKKPIDGQNGDFVYTKRED